MMYIYAVNDHIAAITDKVDADNHKHLTLQISISFCNEFNISISEKQFTCKGIIIDSNINHTFYSNHDSQIFFLIDNLSIFAKQLKQKYLSGKPYCILDDEPITMLRSLLQRYYPILDKESYMKFYSEMLQIMKLNTITDIDMDERIINVLSQIKNCINTEHSLEELAKSVFLSQSRLSHLFKSETGIRLSSYMVLHKLQKAIFYVFNGKNITEASLMAGFDSPSHFASVCKNTLGVSARELNEDSVFLKVYEY